MIEKVTLKPCPFCGGPPCPVVMAGVGGGRLYLTANDRENGAYADAHVFCHECGAQGETVDEVVFSESDMTALESQAIERWNCRDNRHADLYAASAKDGLNLYPREDQ
jgi:hypothetical protein